MPDPLLTLDHSQVKVAPGSQASINVTVRSASSLVEGFRLSVLGGVPGQWTQISPPELDVFPGDEATATVIFSPPSGQHTRSGSFPFGIRAQSTESEDDSAVIEGDVHVGAVESVQSKLIPVTSTGRWRGRHALQITNKSNNDVELQLAISDPDDLLRFSLRPRRIDLGVDQEQIVRITARPRRPILFGAPVRLPFRVSGEPVVAPGSGEDAAQSAPGRLGIDGAFQQKPLLTTPLILAMGVLLVALTAGVVWVRFHQADNVITLGEPGKAVAPENVRVRALGVGRLQVLWNPLEQVTGYRVWTKSKNNKRILSTHIATWEADRLEVAGLRPSTRYCFTVGGLRSDVEGKQSASRCATTLNIPNTIAPSKVTFRYWLVARTFVKVPPLEVTVTAKNDTPDTATPPTPTAEEAAIAAKAEKAAGEKKARAYATAAKKRSLAKALQEQRRLMMYQPHPFINAQLLDSTDYPGLTVSGKAPSAATWIVAISEYPSLNNDMAKACFALKDYRSKIKACRIARAPVS